MNDRKSRKIPRCKTALTFETRAQIMLVPHCACVPYNSSGYLDTCNVGGAAVANRLRRRTSDQTVLGSNPAVAAALSPWTRLYTPIVPRRSLHISFYKLSGHPCKIYTGKKKKKKKKTLRTYPGTFYPDIRIPCYPYTCKRSLSIGEELALFLAKNFHLSSPLLNGTKFTFSVAKYVALFERVPILRFALSKLMA